MPPVALMMVLTIARRGIRPMMRYMLALLIGIIVTAAVPRLSIGFL